MPSGTRVTRFKGFSDFCRSSFSSVSQKVLSLMKCRIFVSLNCQLFSQTDTLALLTWPALLTRLWPLPSGSAAQTQLAT